MASFYTVTLTILLIPVVSGHYLTNRVFKWTHNDPVGYTSVGMELANNWFFYTYKKDVKLCAYQCLKSTICKSFNYNRASRKCTLNRKDHTEVPITNAGSSDAYYHARDEFSIDPEALGPCAGDVCNGHGRCLETKTPDDQLVPICLCSKGWAGNTCDMADAVPTWGAWQAWDDCSVTCDRGYRLRQRNCEDGSNGQTLNSMECYGRDIEYEACQLQDCPRWDPWASWGQCTTYQTCGRGYKVRHRTCNNGGVPGVDRYCLGPTNETTVCYGMNCKGLVRLRGGTAHGEGRVEIFNDVKREWGLVCADQWTQQAADLVCKHLGMPGAFQATQDARFGSGDGMYGVTSLTCSGHERTVQMCERNPWSLQPTCTGTTEPGGVMCKVNGVWSLWAEWGDCSVTCENGIRQRTRLCNHPPALHGGRDCVGDSLQTKSCTLDMCPVDGVWRTWGDWSSCSMSCGKGTQWRERTCEGPFYNGMDCKGDNKQTQECEVRQCPVDGEWQRLVPGDWEAWAAWSPCSVTCGGGKKSRSRVCDMTSHGDLTAPCDGSENEIVDCHTFACRPLARTCSEWGNRGLTASTMADIDPDEDDPTLEPTVVYCNMTAENGVGVTVIGHQAEEEQEVVGYEGAGEYVLEIEYNVTLAHAIAIIDASENCRQFVRWRCKAALIHNPNGEGQITTGWRNRTGGIADYFGDAVPGSGMCTCGMDHSCADDEELACNCDKNDDQWREDSGYLSFKADLPVTEFLAGDTGGMNEGGKRTLGPCLCWGVQT